jgi:hypothetical protein
LQGKLPAGVNQSKTTPGRFHKANTNMSNFAHFIFPTATPKLLKAWIEACFPAINSALKNPYFPLKNTGTNASNLKLLRAKP